MNVIDVPVNHKMFGENFAIELNNFIFDEFILTFSNGEEIVSAFEVKYKPLVENTRIYPIVLDGEAVGDDVGYEIHLNLEKERIDVMCTTDDPKFLNIGFDIGELVLTVIAYIMSDKRSKTQKQRHSKTKHDVHAKKLEPTITTERNDKIFLLDEIVEYVDEQGLTAQPTGTHTITCPCWGVRGHYRHYKSGKTVFVKAFKKGKDRETAEPQDKIYTV